MMQQAYVGARSLDRGRTWKLVFTEGMFGPKAPHELDAYFGPWTLGGPKVAYFVGSCPACSTTRTVQGTVALWVTKDGGRTFREYKVPALTGYAPDHIRVTGRQVRIAGARLYIRRGSPRKAETVRVS
jgi:hypothetical protein